MRRTGILLLLLLAACGGAPGDSGEPPAVNDQGCASAVEVYMYDDRCDCYEPTTECGRDCCQSVGLSYVALATGTTFWCAL